MIKPVQRYVLFKFKEPVKGVGDYLWKDSDVDLLIYKWKGCRFTELKGADDLSSSNEEEHEMDGRLREFENCALFKVSNFKEDLVKCRDAVNGLINLGGQKQQCERSISFDFNDQNVNDMVILDYA